MNKKSIILSSISLIMGLLITIYLASYVLPYNAERVEVANQKVIESTLNLLDVCINTKTLGDITNCDRDIQENISKICKDNNVKECDSKITKYYDTRDARIEQAHAALNSAFRNVILTCDASMDSSCDQSLNQIEDYCTKYVGTIAYVDACDELETNLNQINMDNDIGLLMLEKHFVTCQTIYDEYLKMQNADDIEYVNYAFDAKNKIDSCLVESNNLSVRCVDMTPTTCDDEKLDELRTKLEEAKYSIDDTIRTAIP